MSTVVAQAFRFDKLVLATTTYNGGLFPAMREFINHLTEREFQNRTLALIENGSWASMAGKLMRDKFEKSKNIRFDIQTLLSLSYSHNGYCYLS